MASPTENVLKKTNNEKLIQNELKTRDEIGKEDKYSYLYPSLDDPMFNIKISERKEFYDTRYEKPAGSEEIEEVSDKLCNADFELAPHQMFVRNFLSFQTPYNGLLLYHGLGSGKTCTAISVAEEMRNYIKQLGILQRIIVVASPNVQENFKLQLFDERKLHLVDGMWNIRACTGNKFLSEINPMNMKGLSREKVISQVKQIISSSYLFLGYIEFANYINKKSEIDSDIPQEKRAHIVKQKLTRLFKNRLIIIDEVHNIRMTDDNKDKRVASELMKLVQNVQHMRLLFLSATPMYNSYKEIVWLLNILNANDGRSTFSSKDVFNIDGTFKTDGDGEEIGKELLIRKATGYVSFVRGENPYTFPFRIWPSEFEIDKTLDKIPPPTVQMNGTDIIRTIEHLSLYLCDIGTTQQVGYDYIIDRLKSDEGKESKRNMPTFENMESFGYTILQRPLEALNIIYPDSRIEKGTIDPKELVGKVGLSRLMKFKESASPIFRGEFEYRTLDYGKIFSQGQIGKYSGKINNICKSILGSEGVILIYSQYIDGGLVPIALALESMGLRRAGGRPSLFKVPQADEIDAISFKTREQSTKGVVFSTASYVMITGDKALSPDNVADLKISTNIDNKDGKKVKVILISQAGSEGLDFKFIRQVHVLEPWYNMNRIEQIIGRAVRTCSHKDLPFLMRNVQIFLYGSIMSRDREEAADMYVYRLAELKSVQIGIVSRALKEIAIDCILNSDQTGFTIDDMNTTVKQKLSTGETIDYEVGDRPYTSACDYMRTCDYKCKPSAKIDSTKIVLDTYNESFIILNNDKIIQRIRDSFKDGFFYSKERLIGEINATKNYPLIQINAALNQIIEDKNEYIIDMYGRIGRLVNIGDVYLFQPLEINDNTISLYDRSVPTEYKRNSLLFEIQPQDKVKEIARILPKNKGGLILDDMRINYTTAHVLQTIDAGTDDWYMFCSVVMPHLVSEGWKQELLDILLVAHIIESLQFDELITIINHLEKTPIATDDMFISLIRKYIRNIVMKSKGILGIQLQDIGKLQIIVSSSAHREWTLAQPQDIHDLSEEITKNINNIMPVSERLSNYIGFMVNFKKDYMIFKIRDMSQKRNTGARCDQASKIKSVQFLNSLGEEQYTTTSKFSKQELCIIQELLLRKFDVEKKDGKKWFLTPTEALIVNHKKKT